MFKSKTITLFVASIALLNGAAIAAETHYWYDGDQRRPLVLDSDRVVVFAEKSAPQIRQKSLVSEKTIGETPAPLFSHQGNQRSLPGGIIVTLAGNLNEASARALLVSDGLAPVRMLADNPNQWLVASPAGLASLELANRLHESKKYQAVQPNWWQPRVKK
jgi:hypothetical protein